MYGAFGTSPTPHLKRNSTIRHRRQTPFQYLTMGSFKSACLWFLLYLTIATFAHPNRELQSLHLTTIEKRELDTLNLHKRCVGSCEACFGQGYQECASSSSICFKPGDLQHGEETCSSSGTTVPTVPITDYCSDGSCEQCFGAGSTECPGSTSQCYTPGDSKSGIESCSSSGSSSSSETTPSASSDVPAPSTGSDSSSTSGSNITSTDFCDNGGFDCKRCFGNSYIPCPDAPTSYCYDPNNSTSVCPDGTSPAGSSGSSGGSDITSGSTDYTASTSPATANTDTTETSAATGTSNVSTNVIGITTSPTFTSSRTSSAGGSSQTSATSGGSDGSPASATGNGQPSVGEGKFGVVAVLALCFTAAAGLIL